MIYLDNAATSFPKAPGVSEAMARFLAEDAANPGRSGHRMAVRAEQMLDDLRLKLTRLVDGDDPHRMVLTHNCTDALNMAIHGVLPPGSRADDTHVATTVLEHNSVSRPLESLARDGRIGLTRVNCDDEGFVDPDEIRRAMTPATRLVVMTHASNVLGTIQDIASVGATVRESDALFLVDAAQSIGAVPISVRKMGIDLLAFPGHKSLLGPTGTGGLYVGSRVPEAPLLRPWRVGGTGGDSSSPTQPHELPYYLEGGTPNTVGAAGLSCGVAYVVGQGIGAALAHEQALVARVIEALDGDARFEVLGSRDAPRRTGAVSLRVAGFEPSDVGAILDDSFGIAVRPGLHCAPYAHRRFGTFPAGAIRVSPGPFSTADEVDQLIEALREIAS